MLGAPLAVMRSLRRWPIPVMTRHEYRRPELRDAATNYVLDHGIAGFSLRPAAQALGVT